MPLVEVKALQDWTLEREFLRVPRIGGVVSFGGTTKRYEIYPDQDRLKHYDVTLQQLQGAVNVHSHVRAVPGVAGYDVVLSDLSANLEQLRLTAQASLSGLLTPQPTFAFTFAASPIRLSQLLTTVPAEWVHPRLPAIIQDREIDGMLREAGFGAVMFMAPLRVPV